MTPKQFCEKIKAGLYDGGISAACLKEHAIEALKTPTPKK